MSMGRVRRLQLQNNFPFPGQVRVRDEYFCVCVLCMFGGQVVENIASQNHQEYKILFRSLSSTVEHTRSYSARTLLKSLTNKKQQKYQFCVFLFGVCVRV